MAGDSSSTGLASGLGLAGIAAGIAFLLYAGLRWASDYFRGDDKRGSDQGLSKSWQFREVSKQCRSTVAAINRTGRGDGDVRAAIEKFAEGIIGEGLDQVQVTRISFHPKYEEFMNKYEGPLSLLLSRLTASFQLLAGDLPTGIPGGPDKILGQLKQLIKHIIAESVKLPSIQKLNWLLNLESLATKSYEDILAIAILNKVVETQQLLAPGLQATFGGSNEEEEEETSDEESVGSSPDAWEDNWSESTDPLSMKDHLIHEDISENGEDAADMASLNIFFNKRTAFPEFGVDIVHAKNENPGFERNLLINSWEENWLFKRKKLKQNVNTSVSMLVPSSIEPAKAYIGERDADETSNLTDCSDSEIEEVINSKYETFRPTVNFLTLPQRDQNAVDNQREPSLNNDKESDSGIFEETVIRGSLNNVAYRCKEGSHHFTVNPLFLDDSCYKVVPVVEQHYTSLQLPKSRKTKTRHLVLPPREELFTSSLSSLKDIRKS